MSELERVIIGSDHGAFLLKEKLRAFIAESGIDVEDAGTYSDASVSYVDYAKKVAGAVSSGKFKKGILLCGTGLGMSMAANRFPGVRAALCSDLFSARMSREHNDSNILVIGGRVTGDILAIEIVKVWLETPFEGGRHLKRIQSIEDILK
ncbi:ribose 5-phosphate isomerase B [Desulfamplus magnetovallimortis]|uniref:Ribose 5-phosphate isomerase B n=1 Tax=Desulfamplus magnetovallimortis TaxID=1246637 RepID=A0A1W1HA31_9BACT|nr:ribose 5-phosphate isomerase B [Desulfamplus magnetovallimortis]SLM29296.1 ribose 5-phosphate isomerase B [Desulfamplus magnetovallimortis]